jgi:NarL family two-component system response regulator LiaR
MQNLSRQQCRVQMVPTGTKDHLSGVLRPSAGPAIRPRVLLVSPNLRTRDAAARILHESGRFEMAAKAADAREATRLAATILPDLVLLDLPASGEPSRVAMQSVLKSAPNTKILIWSREEVGELGLEALRAGAAGFVAPDLHPDALVRTLSGVVAGEPAISRRFATWLIARAWATPERRTGMRPVKSELTTREWEVLDLVSAGISKTAIARDLRVSVGTVRSHLRSLSRKLSIDGREPPFAGGSAP